jgi:hypothetical protein
MREVVKDSWAGTLWTYGAPIKKGGKPDGAPNEPRFIPTIVGWGILWSILRGSIEFEGHPQGVRSWEIPRVFTQKLGVIRQ